MEMIKNCSMYKSENCPKNLYYQKEYLEKDNLSMIFFGCWGTYCRDSTSPTFKLKFDGTEVKLKDEPVTYVSKTASDLMIAYAEKKYMEKKPIDTVIIAGDNIYQLQSDQDPELKKKVKEKIKEINKFLENITSEKEKKKEFAKFKKKETQNLLNNMKLQLKDGFEGCIGKIKAKKFLVGIGNHDILTCEILNEQLNYPKWILPALSYTYQYILNDGTIINLIFIDTNLYSDEPFCNEEDNFYQKEAIEEQEKWLSEILLSNMYNYNIIIGHVPFLANPHKEKETIEVSELMRTIIKYKNYIDLYLCADEHNQQYIQYHGINEIISGTGGASLDPDIFIQNIPHMKTIYTGCGPGFVGIDINAERINIMFKILDTIANYEIPRRVTFR